MVVKSKCFKNYLENEAYCKEKNVKYPLYEFRVTPKNELQIDVILPEKIPD
jgi:hypothetical protein